MEAEIRKRHLLVAMQEIATCMQELSQILIRVSNNYRLDEARCVNATIQLERAIAHIKGLSYTVGEDFKT
jgi:hypothetical protein